MGPKARPSKLNKYMYEPLIGDPCYRYNKCAKEKFFKNRYLAFLFIQWIYFHGSTFITQKQWRQPDTSKLSANPPQDPEGKVNCLKSIFKEFVKLSLKTLERCSEEHPQLWERVSSEQLEGLNALLLENHFDKCRISPNTAFQGPVLNEY